MLISMLKNYFGKKVYLVVQGHAMSGVLSRSTDHDRFGYVELDNDDALYEPALINADQISVIRSFKQQQ